MVERIIEKILFNARWLLAPMFLGLAACLAVLTLRTLMVVFETIIHAWSASESQLILDILSAVDLTLTAALLVIVIFSGYENFVSQIDTEDNEDRPEWMGTIDFTGLKLKLMSSIVAISAVQLLRAFMDVSNVSDREMAWRVGLHGLFVVSGLVMALTDRTAGHGGKAAATRDERGH